MVGSLADGKAIEKDKSSTTNPVRRNFVRGRTGTETSSPPHLNVGNRGDKRQLLTDSSLSTPLPSDTMTDPPWTSSSPIDTYYTNTDPSSYTSTNSVPAASASPTPSPGINTPPWQTQTPTLLFTSEILYLLANVSSLVGVKWYLGVPFNDTTNLRLEIAESGEQILGGNLLGLQVGNEPDLYARHGHRPTTYAPSDYFGEFGVVVQAINNDNSIPVKNNLIGPNLATGDWIPEQVWDTGFIPAYTNSLSALAVEHYPTDNCFAMYGVGSPIDLPTEFAAFMSHSMGINTISIYMNSSQVALAANKPFLMFETNTASCGGFPGISDSYGAALWGVDYALQMAYSNFSGALFHIGGQNVYYNPFTPPPTNQSTFRQWSIGPLYYSALVVAEAIGSTGKAQIVDLQPNANNQYTPAYAIYENGAAAKVVLLNYMTDPSGANDYTATIQVQGVSSVQVKYLSAPSVSTKANITWAGQTFGDKLSSDGRLQGTEDVQTVPCNNGACPIKVTAPGLALVFLSNTAYSDSAPSTTQTFATTAYTKTQHTATVAATVLATSNGHSGSSRQLGSTSKGSTGGAGVGKQISGLVALVAMVAGAWTVGKGLLA
ncbi:glycoside hydrolase family 79 protein [Jaapia argillacea MUCL 33604]|uniref:Glycoside hydrolase family 79 protein n=1 Tax=Jaapia argillacea MUCL 33604 TaxID=933084 RepID=A0A067PMJ3_9AGAM|nr:glycoside hydrolase family 79 protein [Jaapia argillacea MUCL 33604]